MSRLRPKRFSLVGLVVFLASGIGACTPAQYRQQADGVALRIVADAQQKALGRSEPFTIERPADELRRRLLLEQDLPHSGRASLGSAYLTPVAHWPEEYQAPAATRPAATQPAAANEAASESGMIRLGLVEALQVAARFSREYQARKEEIFRAALALDLREQEFRDTFTGALEGLYSEDLSSGRQAGLAGEADLGWSRRFRSGARLTAGIGLDLVKLLTMDRASSLGIVADGTMTVPLLRGAGRHIAAEPLTQAQRDVIYAVWSFERFKQTFAVRIASQYLAVLQQMDQVRNAEDNYRRLEESARRARRLADAGRLPEIQVDQARQDELRARDRWIAAQQAYARQLDEFRIALGLPTDSRVELDRAELDRLVGGDAAGEPGDSPAQAAGGQAPSGPAFDPAVRRAIEQRLDLRVSTGRVHDAQRAVVVAADALGPELTLAGSASMGSSRSIGSAGSPSAELRPERGAYSLALAMDLPLERTAERNAYRNSLIALEQATRAVQESEDQVKIEVRNAMRRLVQADEATRIQSKAVVLARRRVESTELFLQAGRAQIRDVLEAEEALVSAQNALTAARVSYRVAQLELRRDMGMLVVDQKGLFHED